MCALRRDDGSIESNQRRQGLGHPVSYHSHGAEHRTNLQHGNTHPDAHTFTQSETLSCSHTQTKVMAVVILKTTRTQHDATGKTLCTHTARFTLGKKTHSRDFPTAGVSPSTQPQVRE